MSAGRNNPILIERQIEILKDYRNDANKTIDAIRENINHLSVISDKASSEFYDNHPINARTISQYIDKIGDNLEEIENDSNFKYMLQQLEQLDENLKQFEQYFNQSYLKTMEQN